MENFIDIARALEIVLYVAKRNSDKHYYMEYNQDGSDKSPITPEEVKTAINVVMDMAVNQFGDDYHDTI
jgi:hypothetical protein